MRYIKFKAQDPGGKGVATVSITSKNKIIDSCEIKVRTMPSVKNIKDIMHGGAKK